LQVRSLILKELKYLSGLYPYNIKKFFDPRMLNAANIFTFLGRDASLSDDYKSRLINLIAGIELLSTGVNLHSFNTDDFVMLAEDIRLKPNRKYDTARYKSRSEKNYTVDLLYGDILYSRAVIYLLEYQDYYIFESILESLKSVHRNRLLLHQKLAETASSIRTRTKIIDFETRIEELIEESEVPILGINSLLKTSFLIGWGLFGNNDDSFPYETINDFLFIKALQDLSLFFAGLPADFFFLKKIKYIENRKNITKARLNGNIEATSPAWLRENLKGLGRLYL
jgi:hypothetical protein